MTKRIDLPARIDDEYRIEYLVPSELEKRLLEKAVLYFPVGSIEWHNEHLPLGTDTLHSMVLASRLCKITGGVVIPPFWWNTGGCHVSDSTYYMTECHYLSVLKNICMGFSRIKARLLVVINGHGGRYQHDSMETLAKDLNNDKCFPMRVVIADPYHLAKDSPCRIDHADTGETSLSLELIEDLVMLDNNCTVDIMTGLMPFAKGKPSKDSGRILADMFMKEAVELIEEEYKRQEE